MRLIIFLAAVATTAAVAIDPTSPNPIRVAAAAKPVRHPLLRRGDLEHVVLADCTRHVKSGTYLQISQLAYFVGPPDDVPDRITNVTSDKQQAWAGSGKITIKSIDNVAFTVEIPTVVGEGQFAGSGHNGYSAFSCYARFKAALYNTTKTNGLVCDQVYDCDHTTPPVTSTTQSPSTATSATANGKSSGTDTSSAQPTGSSNPGAGEGTKEKAGLSQSDIVALAASLGVGIPSLIIALITLCVQLRKRKRARTEKEGAVGYDPATASSTALALPDYPANPNAHPS